MVVGAGLLETRSKQTGVMVLHIPRSFWFHENVFGDLEIES